MNVTYDGEHDVDRKLHDDNERLASRSVVKIECICLCTATKSKKLELARDVPRPGEVISARGYHLDRQDRVG